MNRLLLVTFPVDFGSRTTAKNLEGVFRGRLDLQVFSFASAGSEHFETKGVNKKRNRFHRFADLPKLWNAVRTARAEGRSILFHHVSPALFALPLLSTRDCFITTEWNRKLLEPVQKKVLSPFWLTFLHRLVLRRVRRVLPMTEACKFAFLYGYRLPIEKIARGKKPFALENFPENIDRNDGSVRLLFVGNDFHRKGGDILLKWFLKHSPPNAFLTLVTNGKVEECSHPRVTIERGIKAGSERQFEVFSRHDLFVFPTLSDAIPVAVGEAAAAGLAVCTTRFGLGASDYIDHSWNGFVENDQTAVLQRTEWLIKQPDLIHTMKRRSRAFMSEHYSTDAVFQCYFRAIFTPEELESFPPSI